jgi:hypothetical protein
MISIHFPVPIPERLASGFKHDPQERPFVLQLDYDRSAIERAMIEEVAFLKENIHDLHIVAGKRAFFSIIASRAYDPENAKILWHGGEEPVRLHGDHGPLLLLSVDVNWDAVIAASMDLQQLFTGRLK